MRNNSALAAQARRLLVTAINSPDTVSELPVSELDLTLRVARRARLLARLCVDLEKTGNLGLLPQVAVDQLLSARAVAHSRARLAKWELNRIEWALGQSTAVKPVAMKGCAYLLLDLPLAPGRIFADVDLMVPEEQLEDLENHLNERGWRTAQLSPYDQHYYRRWTHELPPLMHVDRDIEVDLHHNIIARTARLNPEPEVLLGSATIIENSCYQVLANEAIVLHAITHLMFGDDLADKAHELVDIHDLLKFFSAGDENFWNTLVNRADALNLRRPTYYGLRYVERLLGVSVPDYVTAAVQKWAPPAFVVALMDRLVPRALFPQHPEHRSMLSGLCRQLLFIRSHWIRMPPWLLAYHLGYKFYLTRIRRVSKTHSKNRDQSTVFGRRG